MKRNRLLQRTTAALFTSLAVPSTSYVNPLTSHFVQQSGARPPSHPDHRAAFLGQSRIKPKPSISVLSARALDNDEVDSTKVSEMERIEGIVSEPNGVSESDLQQQPKRRNLRPQREPDSPDRAISIVAELKANAALFAAFAYGGLSIPGTLSVTESKVTSVTSSISISRPLPGNDLIEAFVVLDVVTLCLMISCVAASQLLIYRLTNGSWYDNMEMTEDDSVLSDDPTFNRRTSALGRLVTEYNLEFAVARTTFDLGLVTLLLAVAVRIVAIFDVSITLPVVTLLGGTCTLLALAYLQSYLSVFGGLPQKPRKEESTSQLQLSLSGLIPGVISLFTVAAVANGIYTTVENDSLTFGEQTAGVATNVASKLEMYSKGAGESKLKTVVDNVTSGRAGSTKAAQEKSSRVAEALSKKKQLKKQSAAPASPDGDRSKGSEPSAVVDTKSSSEKPSATKSADIKEIKEQTIPAPSSSTTPTEMQQASSSSTNVALVTEPGLSSVKDT